MMDKKIKSLRISNLNDITPFVIFFIIAIFFGIATEGKIFSPFNLRILVDQSITTLVAGLGLVFVIALGGTDITAGAVVALAGYSAYLLGCRHGTIVAFAIAIAVGLASGFVLGFVNAKRKVASFMASLAIGPIALRGFTSIIIQGYTKEVIITREIAAINTFPVKIPIVCVLIVVIVFIFHFTPFGYNCRAIGENEVAAKYTGVNVKKVKILAFMISGMMAGIAAVFTISRASCVQSSLGTGFEMNVMMAIFVAGVPVNGGMGAKIYKLFLGAFSLLILQTGMVLCGLSGAVIQGVRGIILLAVVYLSVILNEKGSGGVVIKLPGRGIKTG